MSSHKHTNFAENYRVENSGKMAKRGYKFIIMGTKTPLPSYKGAGGMGASELGFLDYLTIYYMYLTMAFFL